MSIISGSHKKYEIINQALAKSFNGSVKNNNVTQAGHIYDELIEDLDLEKKMDRDFSLTKNGFKEMK